MAVMKLSFITAFFCLSEAVGHDIKENDRTQPAGYRKGLSFRLGVDTSAHGSVNVA